MGIKEETYFEGGPHTGDLIISCLLGLTVICLPLTVGAIVRALWLRYRITDRRITVTGGWKGHNRSDIVYSQVRKVITVPRGWGAWGDMVITLKDGNRLELRAVPKFRELAAYIQDKLALPAQAASGALGS